MVPGQANDPFPSTRWSRVLAAGDPHNPDRRRDLDALARDYWQPIRIWLQGFCRVPAEVAADLAQDFFVHVIERDTVGRAEADRGSFRSFLKAALRNFAIDRHRRERTQKRGGQASVQSLGDEFVGEPASPSASPDRALDDAFREALLQRALAILKQELLAADKGEHWELFAEYFLAAEPDLDYAALAARHGVSTTAVGNHLMFAKRRFRALLHQAVAETVVGEQALAEELAWLFAGVKV